MLEKQNFLDVVFSRNAELKWEADANGIVTIFVKNSGFWNKITQKTLHKPAVSKLLLDKLGSFIWQKIDGNTNVYKIGQDIKDKFGKSAEPLYERLAIFMKQLERNGLIERKH